MNKWHAEEREDGDVDLKIEHDNGEVEIVAIKGLPQPGALRRQMLQTAVTSILSDMQVRLTQHAYVRLKARIGELEDRAARELKAPPTEPAAPPFFAELFVSLLARGNSAQALLGDLQEMFQKNVERHGEKQARRKYWMQVASSLAPLVWQWLKRIGFFTVLIDYFRSKLGL